MLETASPPLGVDCARHVLFDDLTRGKGDEGGRGDPDLQRCVYGELDVRDMALGPGLNTSLMPARLPLRVPFLTRPTPVNYEAFLSSIRQLSSSRLPNQYRAR